MLRTFIDTPSEGTIVETNPTPGSVTVAGTVTKQDGERFKAR